MQKTTELQKAMKIIWEGEGNKWDDLYEYPYNDFDRARILERLEKTAKKLQKLFATVS